MSLFVVTAALALAIGCRADLVVNPGFEDSLAPAWSIVYVFGGPSDFLIADRTTASERTGDFGLHFENMHDGTMHAYASQTVSGLAPGRSYLVSAWMRHVWDRTDKYDVYIEAVGGGPVLRSPTSTTAWTQYVLIQTASSDGQIEIRLHYDKFANTVDYKIAEGYFDDVSIGDIPEPGGFIAVLTGLVGMGFVLRRRSHDL